MSRLACKDRNKQGFICLPENDDCIPLAVVIITTASGMHLTFTGRFIQYFIISDFYQLFREIAIKKSIRILVRLDVMICLVKFE